MSLSDELNFIHQLVKPNVLVTETTSMSPDDHIFAIVDHFISVAIHLLII